MVPEALCFLVVCLSVCACVRAEALYDSRLAVDFSFFMSLSQQCLYKIVFAVSVIISMMQCRLQHSDTVGWTLGRAFGR